VIIYYSKGVFTRRKEAPLDIDARANIIKVDEDAPFLLSSADLKHKGGKAVIRQSVICSALLFFFLSSFASSAEKKIRPPAPAQQKAAPAYERRSLYPPDGGLINNARPAISAAFEDEDAGINPLETRLSVDGVDVTASAQSTADRISYTPATPLADGVHKVKLSIRDSAGNPAAAAWTFTVHAEPPKIKILSHKLVQYVNHTPIFVTGAVDDGKNRVTVNGVAAVTTGNSFSAKVDIIEGKNTITAEATDSFGNTGSDYVAVILDSTLPAITITSHLPNSLLTARAAVVSGIIDKKAASVTVTVNAENRPVTVDMAKGAFATNELMLEEGTNTITARAVSSAGNVGSSTINVMVDTVAPNIAVTAPRNMTMTNRKTISVSGTIDDPAAAVEVNNAPAQVSKGAFSLSSVGLSEGSNTITVKSVDPAGNRAKPATITVLLKTTPPAPPRFDELPSVTRKSAITVTGVAEPGSQVEIFMNNRSKGTMGADEKGVFSLNAVLSEGNNIFTAVASDVVGNSSAPSAPVNVFMDTKAPKIL
jgi:hypothetical protein